MFNIGDVVVLGPTPNGSSAFVRLKPNMTYTVEALGSTCSRCGLSGAVGASIRILGAYYCAASFVLAAQPAAAIGKSGGTGEVAKKDPGRSLYSGEVDWFDTLPDPTAEEYATLPTLDQIYEREEAARLEKAKAKESQK
jgi:hypothetical protein